LNRLKRATFTSALQFCVHSAVLGPTPRNHPAFLIHQTARELSHGGRTTYLATKPAGVGVAKRERRQVANTWNPSRQRVQPGGDLPAPIGWDNRGRNSSTGRCVHASGLRAGSNPHRLAGPDTVLAGQAMLALQRKQSRQFGPSGYRIHQPQTHVRREALRTTQETYLLQLLHPSDAGNTNMLRLQRARLRQCSAPEGYFLPFP